MLSEKQPKSKRMGYVAQIVECLPSKLEVLSSVFTTTNKKTLCENEGTNNTVKLVGHFVPGGAHYGISYVNAHSCTESRTGSAHI
jgi:hypothetical protein